MITRVRADPGVAFLWLALVAVVVLYAPTLGRGLINYDDTWLVADNFHLHELTTSSLHTIFFDTSSATRFILGAEYLPVRDLSIAVDWAMWGDWYAGFHLTNLAIYLVSVGLWFAVLLELGIDRRVAGLAILLWAIHPAHAESVAWISERKGLLGLVFAGITALGYLRFRCGRSAWWLVFAVIAALLTVWSKALFAFAIASLVPLELIVPGRRSWRRSLVGLGCIGFVGLAAFIPVVLTATNLHVVDTTDHAPAGWLAMVVGGHGFYLQLAVAAFRNAVSYPIMTHGPSSIDLALGAVGLLAMLALAVAPVGRCRVPIPLRIAAIIWLVGWLPASRLVLPLKAVLFADRYILFSSLGVALAAAVGLLAIDSARARNTLLAAIVLALVMRTLDAQSNWRDTATLWQRAVVSNPNDGDAWASYVEALEEAQRPGNAYDALREGLQHSRAPRLLLRKALLVVEHGQRSDAVRSMREAAEAGEPRAMVNLAILLSQDRNLDEALEWTKRAAAKAPLYAKAHKTVGGVLLAMKRAAEAVPVLQRAHELSPLDLETRRNLAIALIRTGRGAEAREHLEACMFDPRMAAEARRLLAQLSK
jgi:tetratricopeptide (TPR) repeat protein